MSYLFPALSLFTHKQNTSPHVVTAWYPTADFLMTTWLCGFQRSVPSPEHVLLKRNEPTVYYTKSPHLTHYSIRGQQPASCRRWLWRMLTACLPGLDAFKCSLVPVTFSPAESFSSLISMGWHSAARDWTWHTHTLLLIYDTQGYASSEQRERLSWGTGTVHGFVCMRTSGRGGEEHILKSYL